MKGGKTMATAFFIACGSVIVANFAYMTYVYFCGNPFK